ncbi:carboxypeptidase-like regulatory domain-containing protein [Rubrivirga sp. IMCC43871]|uniref:carboxypeptidase-like regulatory domain-containing protein n=1 Tax=Rubrivirga sp. IMCC43871 TaxID=3391575 RepID=UPI0039900C06
MNRFVLPSLLLLGVVLWGCLDGAPHENPLDPLSERFRNVGVIEGRATGVYAVSEGRADVRIRLLPLGGGSERVTTTDETGAFQLTDVPAGTYLLRAEADGLQPEEVEVVVAATLAVRVDLRLNAEPVVLSASARTAHSVQVFPDAAVYTLMVEADVTDPDRSTDVETVEVVSAELRFRAPLAKGPDGRYHATLDESVLPGGRIQSLLGRTLRIEVTDVFGATAQGPTFSIARVIELTPVLVSPQGSEVVSTPTPTFEWREVLLPFSFTLAVEISLVDASGVPNLVQSVDGLPPFATSYTAEVPLSPGDYVWTLRITDPEGNTSRSRRAGFRVPSPSE